ncbi:MAG: cupredoxin domain-containing protein [Acidobacteriales bacterium]|nr:cupredoxin domain-containing protein [Terriglobales bacterium]
MSRTQTALYVFCAVLACTPLSCSKHEGPARTIKVVMKKYSIEPAEIHVRQGENVVLEVTTTDVQHGFDVPDLNVSESIQPGMTATFRLPTGRKGNFTVECGVICGPRHDQMRGKVVVD